MAIRTTTELVKFKNLQADLGLSLYETLGLLEAIWHFTARNTIRGNIGKYSNQDIATWIEWKGDADKLIDALVRNRWLDVHEVYRLIVHAWNEHADKGIKITLKNKKMTFVQEENLTTIPKRLDWEPNDEVPGTHTGAPQGQGQGQGQGLPQGQRGIGEKPMSLEEKAADLATEFHFHFKGRKPVLEDLRTGFQEKLRHYGEDKFDAILEAIRGDRDKTQYFLGFWMALEKTMPAITKPPSKPPVLTKSKELLKYEADLALSREQAAKRKQVMHAI